MPSETAELNKRLSALSPPARHDLFAFLEISATVPGPKGTDEATYFSNLLELRLLAQKNASGYR